MCDVMLAFWITAAVIVVAMAVIVGFLLWGVGFSCERGKSEVKLSESKYKDYIKEGLVWIDAIPKKEVVIKSYDGLTLAGRIIENDKTDIIMALFHGYRSAADHDFSVVVREYYELGHSVLLVDQRSHGKSEGKYITYGTKERFDCRDWCQYLKDTYPDKRVVLDGISMGATTVLLASGIGLPDNVIGIIADCGFTSPYEIISKVAGDMKYPEMIVMPLLRQAIRAVADFDPKECNTCDALKKNTLPLIMVHGADDSFVPCEMSKRAYEACASPKKLIVVEGADHGMSYMVDHERVDGELRAFLNAVSNGKSEW